MKAAGIDVCVGTQGKPSKTALTLGITGLRELFDEDAIFTAYEVPRGKPFPDLFLHAAKSRGVDPVEDRSRRGHDARRHRRVAAGMTVFGYAHETPAQAIEVAGGQSVRRIQPIS